MSQMALRGIASVGHQLALRTGCSEDGLQFERRRADRVGVRGDAVAVFTDDAGPGKIASVTLVDSSETGLAVLSPFPISPGASFSLVPDQSLWHRHVGMVVRCEPKANGYLVGMRCRAPRSAA